MTKRELVEKYRLLVLEIEALDKQSKFLNKYIGGPRPLRAIQLTGMPRGTNNPEAAMIQQMDDDDAIFELERKEKELRDLVAEFERVMESIPDDTDRIILRDYYALNMTDKEIAEKLNYDASTIWKRRTRTMNSLDGQVSY
jgi:DNA-directed RNA polymerase specialized sigma24 family protein